VPFVSAQTTCIYFFTKNPLFFMPTTISRVNQREKIITSDGTIFYGELDAVNKKIVKLTQENGVVLYSDIDPIKALSTGEAFIALANFAIAQFNPPPPPPPPTDPPVVP
jgi:hypothetical protein